MAEKEHGKPLASVPYPLHSDAIAADDGLLLPPHAKLSQKHKYIKCCGCFIALLLILAVVGIILGFTIFHIQSPSIQIVSLSLSNGISDGDVTLIAGVSVKNPNFASFKYAGATTKIHYDGMVIGEGETLPGEAKARRTMIMNMTVKILREKIMGAPGLMKDLSNGELKVSSYTKVPGKVRIMGFIKKDLVVKMNCSLTYDTKNQMIEGDDCEQDVEIN